VDRLGPYLLGPNDTPENGIYTGDARELARAIPDESVDLIFTDPVYDRIDDYRWLAETAARVLKIGSSLLAFCGHRFAIKAGAVMLPYLEAGPILEHYVAGAVGRLFSHSVQCNLLPCLWFSKGMPKNNWMFLQQLSISKGNRGHVWGKNSQMVSNRMERFTMLDDIAIDPFAGGGTVPAVCKMLGRRWLAFEIDPDMAEDARQRVRQTQPPLFVPQPQQAEMAL
jgi:hypothetical protein